MIKIISNNNYLGKLKIGKSSNTISHRANRTQRKIRIYFKLNDNEYIACKKLWNAKKVVLREVLID